MRTFKRSVSILILSGALAAASQAGQVHGQPLPEQARYDAFNYWRNIFNFMWSGWGPPTIQYLASMVGS